ncbi:threonine synthase, partial [candidate division MSBL1 archaeon SCGC-AAA259B11]
REFERECVTTWKYRPFLPVREDSKIVSLHEGGTPLYSCDVLAEEIGVDELYVKFEGGNPTGSFKDRGMTVGVTKALEYGADVVACASTGNTSSSLAAYSAKAGLDCVVLTPKGKVALGKMAQAALHGAKIIAIEDNFDKALKLVRRLCNERDEIYLLNSVNPFRPQGQKTIGFEISDQLGFDSPDRVVVPMGNCANIWAIYKGFYEFRETGIVDEIPKMTGIQAEGASPVVNAVKDGADRVVPVENPETLATAIRIGDPVNGPKALLAIRRTEGTAESVTDEEIVKAQKMLARLEGIGVEPASAASIAGLKKLVDMGEIDRSERVASVVTGHLLKDPEEAVDVSEPPVEITAKYDEIISELGL